MSGTNITRPELTDNDIQRFWSKVDKSPGHGPKGECWLWTAGRTDRGYGRFALTKGPSERTVRAHRVSHLLTTNEWPDLNVLHDCDNPPCCNPAHLNSGTNKENSQQASSRGRLCHGTDQHSSKLTEKDILTIRKLKGILSPRRIARAFRVTRKTILEIHCGNTWKHI